MGPATVCNLLVWGASSNWKKSSHSGLICSRISSEYNKVTFFPLLKAYAIFLRLFLLVFLSLSLVLQLVSPSFPKISLRWTRDPAHHATHSPRGIESICKKNTMLATWRKRKGLRGNIVIVVYK